jgi:hypothetical protein
MGVFLSEAKVKAKAMEMGLADAHGELSEGAKVLARYQLILDETRTAQGDFARTSDQLANQQRIRNAELINAQAELGESFAPLELQITKWQRDFLRGIGVVADAWEDGWKGPMQLANEAALEMARATADGGRNAAREIDSWRPKFRSAAQKFADSLPSAMEGASVDAVRATTAAVVDMAGALRDGREEWQGALDQLGDDLDHRMSTTAEIAKLKAALTGDNIRKGLKSKDPVVRAQAEATARIITDRLNVLEGKGVIWGANLGAGFARGVRSKVPAVESAAHDLAEAAGNYIRIQSPAKKGPFSGEGPEGFGRNLARSWAKGIAYGASGAGAASNTLAGAVGLPGASGGAVGGAGGLGSVNVTINFNGMLLPPTQAQAADIARTIGPAIGTHLRDRGLIPRG